MFNCENFHYQTLEENKHYHCKTMNHYKAMITLQNIES